MALDADTLLDRMQLKQQLFRWRSFAVLLLTLLALLLVHRNFKFTEISEPDIIARVAINGMIDLDRPMMKLFDGLAENEKVKAVIIEVNSPGGTAIGGEEHYLAIKALREVKPVVILMRTLSTSAGYMIALGGDHILAREGTITGSVGVIIQTAEFSEMAEMLGVEPIIVRSGENKAVPNPAAKLEAKQRQMVQEVVDDFFSFFWRIVTTEREFTEEQLAILKDGRIFTGNQAVKYNLIDGIGGEKEALAWLEETHEISAETKIETRKPVRKKETFFDSLNQMAGKALNKVENLPLTLDGLLLIWQPATAK